MITTPLLALALAAVAVLLLYVIRRVVRHGHPSKSLDLGAVSTRWLSELRRDEPWTR